MFELHFRADELNKKQSELEKYEETINDDFIQNFKFVNPFYIENKYVSERKITHLSL